MRSKYRIAKIRYLQKFYMHRRNTAPDTFDYFQKIIDQTIDQFRGYYKACFEENKRVSMRKKQPSSCGAVAVSNLQKWWSNVYDFCVCKAEKHHHINKNEIFDAKKARGLYYSGDIYEFFVEDDDKGRHHTKHAFSGVPVVVI